MSKFSLEQRHNLISTTFQRCSNVRCPLGSTPILTNIVGVYPMNIHTKFEAICEEVWRRSWKSKQFKMTTTMTSTDTGWLLESHSLIECDLKSWSVGQIQILIFSHQSLSSIICIKCEISITYSSRYITFYGIGQSSVQAVIFKKSNKTVIICCFFKYKHSNPFHSLVAE